MNPVPSTRSFAERLNFLLDTVRHPAGRQYRVTEIADAITAKGYSISRGYISALKEGLKPMPSKDCAEAIAEFFGVPGAYFYDDHIAGWVEQEIRLVSSLRNSPVRHISLQAFGLSEASLRVVADTIQHLRGLEGLPDPSQKATRRQRRKSGRRHEPATSGPSEGTTAAQG